MRILKGFFLVMFLIGTCGYAVYHFGTDVASDKIADYVDQEFENAEGIEEVKRQVASNPELQQFLLEGINNVDESTLVFKTKEEAVQAIIKKVGISNLMELQSMASDGVSQEEQSEILSMLEANLSEEEILALKVLANKELNLN